jgi:hypothetical protein
MKKRLNTLLFLARAFSAEVGTGSAKKMRQNQETRAVSDST